MAALALELVPVVNVAVTVTFALSSVRYGGGVYCPLLLIDPAPALGSPPLTDQETEAAPPPLNVAENCSTAWPALLVVLQPVQLVSMVAVPGEIEKVPFDDDPDADPPQPASSTKIGTAPAASTRAGQRLKASPATFDGGTAARLPLPSPRGEIWHGRCASVVTAALSLKVSGAFPARIQFPRNPRIQFSRNPRI
jgi:hypothetical protein